MRELIGGAPIGAGPRQNKPGEHFIWKTTLYRATLSLRPVSPPDLTTQAWHRVDGSPTVAALAGACRPPHDALGG